MQTEDSDTMLDELEGWRLLPWFANGTLTGEEQELVLDHLRASPAAGEELLFLSELRHAVEIASMREYEPSEERLARLLRRIDDHEAGKLSTDSSYPAEPGNASTPESPLAFPADTSSKQTVRGREWAAWGAAAAAVLLLVSVLWSPQAPETAAFSEGAAARFRTLSEGQIADRSVASEGGAVQIRVVFEPATTEPALRDLLLESGLEIVAGPTASGAYTLRPMIDHNGEFNAREILEGLRRDERVAFAEVAVDG